MSIPYLDPSECFELSQYGFGPFTPGFSVATCPSGSAATGYGGSAFGFFPFGDQSSTIDPNAIIGGYGGDPYGFGPYGSIQLPGVNAPISGGYSGIPYGFGVYGSLEFQAPSVSSAISIDGFRVQVFFDEQMLVDSALLDPLSYTFTPVQGAAPVSAVSVEVSSSGPYGATSVIVTHSGTTLGGIYDLTVTGLSDLAGNLIDDGSNTFQFLARGEAPTLTAAAIAGDQIQVDYSQAMLPESDTPGLEQAANYVFTTTYPVPLVINSIAQQDTDTVVLNVNGMTSVSYNLIVTPATALDYQGTTLPSASTSFNGVEVGTGTSQLVGGLLALSKLQAVQYGWQFLDTSGQFLPASSFRVDTTFDATVGSYIPPLFDAALGTLRINDGSVEVLITFTRIGGVDHIQVDSGAFSQTVQQAWSTQPTTVSLVRNQRADSYTIEANGTPLLSALTASFNGIPTIGAGVEFALSPTYEVANFELTSVTVNSTQTVFSAAWNFLHNQSATFVGSSLLTRNSILTQNGPLTKGWGDFRPATVNDVSVRVNGVEVEIADVNPYYGEITPLIPIPLTPPGTTTVEVDYKWMRNPYVVLLLNTQGLVINQWGVPQAEVPPFVPSSDQTGALPSSIFDTRFPMRSVLNCIPRPQPLHISHRFVALQREYSAVLNDPTSLTLNQDPRRPSIPLFEAKPESVLVSYEATEAPVDAHPSWTLQGEDTGQQNAGLGTYTVIDASSGSFEQGTEALYSQDVDLRFPSTVTVSSRFVVDSYTADGVFTGVGFGFHSNQRLFLVGALDVNGVGHVGVLTGGFGLDDVRSWTIGPAATLTIRDATHAILPNENVPTSLEENDRFQVLDGVQAGIYTVTCVTDLLDGTTELEIAGPGFPADPGLFQQDTVSALFEAPWTQTASYRLVAETDTGRTSLRFAGPISGPVLEVNAVPAVPQAARKDLQLDTSKTGQVVFGSIGRTPVNSSTWSFVRYIVIPGSTVFVSQDIIVSSEMNVLPENDIGSQWYLTRDFGTSTVDSTGDRLVLKATSGSNTLDLSYAYARLEPFFTDSQNLDFDAIFAVESESLGFGDAQIVLRDGMREARMGTLLYREDAGATPFRQLINMPQQSLSGLYLPENQGWTKESTNTLTAFARGQRLTIAQALGQLGTWFSELDTSSLNYPDDGGRIIEARFAVESETPSGSGNIGLIFGGEAGTTPRVVALTLLANPARVALTSDGTPLQEYAFDWQTDRAQHTYRILVDAVADTVTLVIDDVVQAPTLNLTSFALASANTMIFVGAFGADRAHQAEWDYVHVVGRPPVDAKRTLAVWLGGDLDNINNFEIPRTDGLNVDNDDATAIIEEMDWRSQIEVRVARDSGWGVSVLRPDLPLPGTANGLRITEITEPGRGWINVEYPRLPLQGVLFSQVLWGSPDPRSISQHRWDFVRYRLYECNLDDSYISPQNQVLNQAVVVNSGEADRDMTPESVALTPVDLSFVTVSDSNIYASQVFQVVQDGALIPFEQWTFDASTQRVTFNPVLTSTNSVTVVFSPGTPFTATYLSQQPLYDGVTLLNEGTPPVVADQESSFTTVTAFGSRINDTNDVLNVDPDFILNDDFTYLDYETDADSLYYCLEQLQVTNADNEGVTGLISSLCDDGGLLEFSFDGSEEGGVLFQEIFKTPKNDFTSLPPFTGGGAPTDPGVIGTPGAQTPGFTSPPYQTFTWSGGGRGSGVLGPTLNTAGGVLYQNYTGGTPAALGTGIVGIQQPVTINLELRSVVVDDVGTTQDLEETFPQASDNTPPSQSTDPNLVPDGTPSATGNGAALVELTTPASYTRLGPFGGLPTLEPNSLLAGSSAAQPTGFPPSGVAFTLVGGTVLPRDTTVKIDIEAAN